MEFRILGFQLEKAFRSQILLQTRQNISKQLSVCCYSQGYIDDDNRWNNYRYGRNNFASQNKYRRNFEDDDFDSDEVRYNRRDQFGYRNRYRQGRRNDMFDDKFQKLSRPNWDTEVLSPFEKNFFNPSELITNRTKEELKEFWSSHNMTAYGENIPNPILNFSEYTFPAEIQDYISQMGFEKPTPIQSQGWSVALTGQDFIGIGQTGSGKTLGFAIPGLIHVAAQKQQQPKSPIALILGPTRELVQQINGVVGPLGYSMGLKSACVFGGAGKLYQEQKLRSKVSICIATPGRLLDFLEMGVVNLKNCTYLVIDEADRMLDMGFKPQINAIVDQIRSDRQTLMWSATWPRDVQELASDFLNKDAIKLRVGSTSLHANPDISQVVEVVDTFDKRERLIDLLSLEKKQDNFKVLIFCQRKLAVDRLYYYLRQNGFNSTTIHGDKNQRLRDDAISRFRSGHCKVLVATDVASRGLDVDDISLVVNYEMPANIEDYIHRIGRTARAGKSGKAHSFFTREDYGITKDLVKLLRQTNQDVPKELEKGMSYRF